MSFVQWLASIFCKDVLAQNATLTTENSTLSTENGALKTTLAQCTTALSGGQDATEQLTQNLSAANTEIAQLKDQLNPDTQLERYLRATYTMIPNIAYTQKRKISDLLGETDYYSIFLNELIQYDEWEILNFMRPLQFDSGSATPYIARQVGDKVAAYLVWRDDINLDKSGDYYLNASEALALRKCDCEDHAYVVMSCHKELGGAWGFLLNITNQSIIGGHAFNVFQDKGQLYVLDTTCSPANIEPYVPGACHYHICFIITKQYTFSLDDKYQFGTIAGWTN